jgi:hypothetical protein
MFKTLFRRFLTATRMLSAPPSACELAFVSHTRRKIDGSAARLEPADVGSAVDDPGRDGHRSRLGWSEEKDEEARRIVVEACDCEWCKALAEAIRLGAVEGSAPGEGQRRRESVDEEDPRKA